MTAQRAAHTPTDETTVSFESYLALEAHSEAQFEYYYGKLQPMSGESLDANRIGNNCFLFFDRLLADKDFDVFRLSVKLRVIEGKLYRYPDLMVVPSASIVDSHEVTVVDLIVEIVSAESSQRDRKDKLKEYTSHFATLKHYLIVDQEEPLVEMYSRRNGDWVYEYFEGLEAVVPIEHFDAELPLATIYKKINFATSRSDS